MVKVVTFCHPEADIATFRAAIAKEHGIFISQCHCYDTLASGLAVIAIERRDDLFFKFILIFWINNAVIGTPFQIQIDVVPTVGNGTGLGPINLIGIIAIFIFLHDSETEISHNRDCATRRVPHNNMFVLWANLTMVRYQNNIPSFIDEIKELPNIIVSLLINHAEKIPILFFCEFKTKLPFIFKELNNHMSLKVDIMIVGEDHINIFFFDHVVQGSAVPLTNTCPVFACAVTDQFFITAANERQWRAIACIINNGLIEATWREHNITINIHGRRDPNFQMCTIFCQLNHTHIARYAIMFVITDGFINDVFFEYIIVKNIQWFC